MTVMCSGRDGRLEGQCVHGDGHGRVSGLEWQEERGGGQRTLGSAAELNEPRVDPPLLLNVEEAARLLGIGRTTLFSLIDQGRIQTVRLGRRRLVVRAGLERFVEELSA